MANLIKLDTGEYPVSVTQFKERFPYVSFSIQIPFDEYGYAVVFPAPTPSHNPLIEYVHETAPELTQLGTYQQTYEILPLQQEQIDTNLIKEKAKKWEAIKADRDSRKNGGALVNTKWFHTDADSRIQQLGLVLMGVNVPAVQWKTMDGTFVIMSQSLAVQIFQAVATLDMNLFANAETHRTALEASERPDLYDFSTGWPEHFIE